MNIGVRLKQWRAGKGLKQDEAASLLGIPYSTYQKYEINDKKPGADALEAMTNAGIDPAWLLTGKSGVLLDAGLSVSEPHNGYHAAKNDKEPSLASNDFALIPYYDVEASAGTGRLVDQELQTSQMAFRKDWLKQKGLQVSQCALIKAKGDSMEPTIHDGDLLLVDRSIDAIKDDAIYIVQTDHHLIVKRIQQSWDGSLTIISDNKRYKEQEIGPEQAKEVKIAGRVRWYGHEI